MAPFSWSIWRISVFACATWSDSCASASLPSCTRPALTPCACVRKLCSVARGAPRAAVEESAASDEKLENTLSSPPRKEPALVGSPNRACAWSSAPDCACAAALAEEACSPAAWRKRSAASFSCAMSTPAPAPLETTACWSAILRM